MKTNSHKFHPNNFASLIGILAYAALTSFLVLSPVTAYCESVTLAWDANTESNLKGYILYYGTSSGNYTSNIDVGNKTQYIISNLQDGVTYYFAVTAYNEVDLESDYSVELPYTVDVVVDSDDDGVPDDRDDFPYDADEHLDTDGDGVGNNADKDDDNDGMPDDWELAYGLNPLKDDSGSDPDGDEISNINEFNLDSAPNFYEGNYKPDTPVLLTPENSAMVNLTARLETDDFIDPNTNDVHSKTQWVIIRAFDNVSVFDVTTKTSLTSITVPKQILEEDSEYLWKVRFIDHHDTPSEWSDEKEFITGFADHDTDKNGVPDVQEVAETLDLDDDGTNDIVQSDIKCVNMENGKSQICISIRDAENAVSIVSLAAEDPANLQPGFQTEGKPNYFEFELLNFKVLVSSPGDETVVTIYLSKSAFNEANCFKYDPVNEVWFDYSDYTDFSSNRKKIYLTLKDGGFGDADGIENGIIVDPLAVGSESDPSNGGSDDSPIDEFFDSIIPNSLSCFISTAANRSDDRSSRNLWCDIRGRELAVIFTAILIIYLGIVVFSEVKRNQKLRISYP